MKDKTDRAYCCNCCCSELVYRKWACTAPLCLLQGHVFRWEFLVRHWTHRQWWGESWLKIWIVIRSELQFVMCVFTVLNVQMSCVTERKRFFLYCPPSPSQVIETQPAYEEMDQWPRLQTACLHFNGLRAPSELFSVKNVSSVRVHCPAV